MMDIKKDWLQWSIIFLRRNQKEVVLKMKLKKISNYLMNFINQLLGNFKKRKVYSTFKDNIWGVDLGDMQLISKYINTTKELDIFYVLLICLVNMLLLFL